MTIDLFTVYDATLAGGQTWLNVWDFGPLGKAIMPLQRGGLPMFASTLDSSIDIIHSTENKAIKEGMTFVNSNYKSSYLASSFMAIGQLH